MATWIDELLEIHYSNFRQYFFAYYSRRIPPESLGDLDDVFHDLCIELINYWRKKEPPLDVHSTSQELALQLLWRRSPVWGSLAQFRFSPWHYEYWPGRIWGRWQAWQRERLDSESLDVDIHDRPERITEGPYSYLSESGIPINAIEVLRPHLKLEDIGILLAFRGAPTYESVAQVLDISLKALRQYLATLRRKLKRLEVRVHAAVVSLLYARVVFLSSTYMDLKDYRRAVIEKIHRLAANGVPIVVIAMEYFMTGTGHPGRRCLTLVRQSDIFVGLFAKRYGSIWDEVGVSFTEAELRAAEGQQMEKCIYFPTDDCLASFPENSESEDVQRITELKERLNMRYVVERFSSTDDLAARVSDRLSASFW